MRPGAVRDLQDADDAARPAAAVVEGWRTLVDAPDVGADAVELAVHGTTLITNALIERGGAVTGLVTTKGFRDVLEMRKEMRYDIYDLLITLPGSARAAPPAPRGRRARDRRRARSCAPLDLEELAPVAATFRARRRRGRRGQRFSTPIATPRTSRPPATGCGSTCPSVAVSLSSRGRAGDPRVRAHVDHRRQRLRAAARGGVPAPARRRSCGTRGFERNLYLMLSSGGITTLETAARFPVRLVESGPAAGVLAARLLRPARRRPRPRLVRHGRHHRQDVPDQGRAAGDGAARSRSRACTGSSAAAGCRCRCRSIELIEIGAGGGSIARVDELGLLKVGPTSRRRRPRPGLLRTRRDATRP